MQISVKAKSLFWVILAHALKLAPGTEGSLWFKDQQEIPGWAKATVTAAVKEGIISGYPEGKTYVFRGGRLITRTEFAAIIACVLVKKLGRVSPAKLTFKDIICFFDLLLHSVFLKHYFKAFPVVVCVFPFRYLRVLLGGCYFTIFL